MIDGSRLLVWLWFLSINQQLSKSSSRTQTVLFAEKIMPTTALPPLAFFAFAFIFFA